MGRRKSRAQRERNIRLGYSGAVVLSGILAWHYGYAGMWLFPLLVVAYYQLCAVPTLCGVETTRGYPCRNRAYGRLMACKDQPLHGMYKNDALLRLAGFRRDPRPITAPAPYSDTSAPETVELQMPEPPTVEPKQLSFAVITVVLAFAGTVATVIQTVLAAAS